MQKFFIITLFALLTSITAAAQTAGEQQAEAAKRTVIVRGADATTKLVVAGEAQAEGERKQVLRVVDGRVLRLGPTSMYLKNGLSRDEVVRLLGKPVTISERREGERLFTTYTFSRGEGRIFVAEFENGLLTASRTEAAEALERTRVE
jgi:hypothetical protein